MQTLDGKPDPGEAGQPKEAMNTKAPTSNSELNAVLNELVTSARAILGDNFVAAYLQGSFALGDWDNDSDVDFTVVINHDLSERDLSALQSMHARIYNLESGWAKHLEGSYFPRPLIKSNDPTRKEIQYLDNTHDVLIPSNHDNTLVVRWVVREYGITLAGVDSKELIDPVLADDLRREISATMRAWAEEIFSGSYKMDNRWAQPFAVLSYCRMLHSLQSGRIASKLAGARWAKSALDARWAGLIQRAWEQRPNPSFKVHEAAEPGEVSLTLEFIRYALELSRSNEISKP